MELLKALVGVIGRVAGNRRRVRPRRSRHSGGGGRAWSFTRARPPKSTFVLARSVKRAAHEHMGLFMQSWRRNADRQRMNG